uniref:Bowman-Birk type proteinase inhibitor 2 n=1 Tax=Cajanus cajan TaxID=3821 RepID=A0A151RI37_CAJCA|nr:Bowman-Birk type proteinase inhibitor 2 [Cajanus cajan]
MMVLKGCFFLLLLVGVTTARMDLGILKSGHDQHHSSKACCDECRCTKSIPPQCHCLDMRLNSCHSACESCVCTFSNPAMCHCVDTTDFCYKPCKSHDDDEKDLMNRF